MSPIAGNQARTFLQLFAELRAHFRSDRNLPARIQQRLASERRFGSRDRRLYRELLYTAVRFLPWIEERERTSSEAALEAVVWLASPIPAVQQIKSEIGTGLGALPATVSERARILGVTGELLPEWVRDQCPLAMQSPNLKVIHSRAPLWLRLQTRDAGTVLREFETRGWKFQAAPVLPSALEVMGDVDVTSTEAFKSGQFEVQDLASQLLLEAVRPTPGTRWLDACAGAGGKTLQLAQLLGASGRVVAQDIRPAALAELSQRARRAGLTNVAIGNSTIEEFDGVLVDAPCSGSGTWRRSPHLKWCTSAEQVAAAARQQTELLNTFSKNVKPGGSLVYATCSLCRDENEGVAESFLAAHPDFAPGRFANTFGGSPGRASLTFWPAVHNSDGFFVAAFQRAS